MLPPFRASNTVQDVTLKLPMTSHRNYEHDFHDIEQPRTFNSTFFESILCHLPPGTTYVQLELRLNEPIPYKREAAVKDGGWGAIARYFASKCYQL